MNSNITMQKGVALVTAILVVAIAATAATTIAANYQYDFRRTTNIQDSMQALSYAKGAEQWAMAILARDAADSTHDSLDEDWAVVLPSFPLPGGGIDGNMEDAQGKINLNALKPTNNPNLPDEIDPQVHSYLVRLFTLLEIDSGLIDRIRDYIDADIIFSGTNGAEADVYIGLDDPYRPADQYMQDISELRLVYGIEPEIYEKLIPHVTALPPNAKLNLNSASAYVLASLDEDVILDSATELVEDRIENPFVVPNDFTQNSILPQQTFTSLPHGTDIQSEYFNLITRAYIGNSEVKMVSLIHRNGPNLEIIKRTQVF